MDNQDTIDPISELFSRVSHSFRKRELSLLLIVGVVGCVGTMSIFSKSFVKRAVGPRNLATIKIVEEAANLTPTLSNIDPYLRLSGDFHTAEFVDFEIENYNPQATYEVHFGDGEVYSGSTEGFSHAYSEEGIFDVELIMHYKQNKNSVFTTSVDIRPSQTSFLSSL